MPETLTLSGNATCTSHDRTKQCLAVCPGVSRKSFCLNDLGSNAPPAWELPIDLARVSPVPAQVSSKEALVKKIEWMREDLSGWPSPDYVKQKESAGWHLVAVEWEREVEVASEGQLAGKAPSGEEIPFGTRISGDCLHLEDNPAEVQVLNHLAEMIVQDVSYNHMADTLNQRGFRTRDAKLWTALAVFKLTPRLIEVAPRILSGAEWESRKKQLSRVTWNS
jgi:hypothetical protein